MTGKSNRSNGVQRAAGWCECGTCVSGEWSRELRSENQFKDWSVGGDGDSTVTWEPDIHVIACCWAVAAYLLSETGKTEYASCVSHEACLFKEFVGFAV